MSRKAASVTFVESATGAARTIESNVMELGLGTRARVVKERALQFVKRTNEQYTLVFIDPPYDIARGDLAAVLNALGDTLPADANIIVEFARRAVMPEWPATIAPLVVQGLR